MGAVELHASVETIQEFLFHRLRRTSRPEALAEAASVRKSVVLHPFDAAVLDGAIELVRTTGLRGRDAVHAATALGLGLTVIATFDTDFDDVPGLSVERPG